MVRLLFFPFALLLALSSCRNEPHITTFELTRTRQESNRAGQNAKNAAEYAERVEAERREIETTVKGIRPPRNADGK